MTPQEIRTHRFGPQPDPKIKARLVDLGRTVLALPISEFGKVIAEDTEKWAKVVKFAGIKPE